MVFQEIFQDFIGNFYKISMVFPNTPNSESCLKPPPKFFATYFHNVSSHKNFPNLYKLMMHNVLDLYYSEGIIISKIMYLWQIGLKFMFVLIYVSS